jgi:ABC-type spermidine/putrescine transport system permease subunit I
MSDVLGEVFNGYLRTGVPAHLPVRALALAGCIAIGYPVAYFTARKAGRSRGLLLAALVLPFWISYLMRMLAWTNLLQQDGFVNQVLGWFS